MPLFLCCWLLSSIDSVCRQLAAAAVQSHRPFRQNHTEFTATHLNDVPLCNKKLKFRALLWRKFMTLFAFNQGRPTSVGKWPFWQPAIYILPPPKSCWNITSPASLDWQRQRHKKQNTDGFEMFTWPGTLYNAHFTNWIARGLYRSHGLIP